MRRPASSLPMATRIFGAVLVHSLRIPQLRHSSHRHRSTCQGTGTSEVVAPTSRQNAGVRAASRVVAIRPRSAQQCRSAACAAQTLRVAPSRPRLRGDAASTAEPYRPQGRIEAPREVTAVRSEGGHKSSLPKQAGLSNPDSILQVEDLLPSCWSDRIMSLVGPHPGPTYQ